MSYYAQMLLANLANEYRARKYAAMLIAGSPAPYMATHLQGPY
jgi:hypothetical protein